MIRDNRNLFEHEEEDFYKLLRVSIFKVTILLKMKIMLIKIKHY